MDIEGFKPLIAGIAEVSRVGLEIRDETGLIFASAYSGLKNPAERVKEALSQCVINEDAFRWVQPPCGSAVFSGPIKREGKVIGALIAYGYNPAENPRLDYIPSVCPPGAKEMEALLTSVARQMADRWASQKETQEMAEELSQSFEDLYLYSRFATQIKPVKFSARALQELVGNLFKTMRVDLAFTLLPQRSKYTLHVSRTESSPILLEPGPFIDGLIRAIPEITPSLDENYFIIPDSGSDPGFAPLHSEPYRFLAVSIKHNGNFYGWMGLVSFNTGEIFRRSELRLLTSIAEQVAVAISNTDLYRDLERFVVNVVKSLVYAIEAKDLYTRGHSERVSRYCMLMADQLGLPKRQRDALKMAALLHDVGKIGIPEAILNKKGKLTDEEQDIVKQHPRQGNEILKPLDQLAASLPGILHHHERFDGEGYPKGLKQHEIPMSARIIAVADTFDAISHNRPYRPAKSVQEALSIIESVAGDQLDPDLVLVLKKVFHKHLD